MPEPESWMRKQATWTVVVIGLVLVAAVLLDPSSPSTFTICSFKTLTGLPCPGCGMGHAFEWLVRGRLDAAVKANMLSPVVFAAMLWAAWRCVTFLLGRREQLWPRVRTLPLAAALVVVLAWWIMRLWLRL